MANALHVAFGDDRAAAVAIGVENDLMPKAPAAIGDSNYPIAVRGLLPGKMWRGAKLLRVFSASD